MAFGSRAGSVTIPFDLVDGRILIWVSIDGHGPYRMIFDSGASAILSPQVAAALRLPLSDTHPENGTGAGPVQVAQASVREARLGAVSLKNQLFDVASMADMPPVFGAIRIDGILGRPVFDRFTVQVNYDKRVVVLIDPKQFQPAASDVPLSFTRIRDVPLVEAKLDGHSGHFGVDLGARSSIILTRGFAEANDLLSMFDKSSEMITGWGLGGPIKSKLARAHTFELDHLMVHSPLVRLSAQKSGLLAKSDTAGLIGGDILRQFTITFDPLRQTVYFRPSKQFGRRTSFDQSGMWLVPGKGGFEVLEVSSGGAASRADIQRDDEVLAVDGHAAQDVQLPDLRERWANAHAGTKVRLRVRHRGALRDAILILTPAV